MHAPLSTNPIRTRRRSALYAVVAVAALLFAGCGGDDGDESTTGGDPSTETTAGSSTTEASTTSTIPADQAGDDDTTPSTEAPVVEDPGTDAGPTEGQLSPGDACSLEEGDPDCIDPDGDGEGVYLIGGADCVATAPDVSICEDLDGDGNAGYPDEYEDLPQCSDEVPPPCNNEPGSDEE